MYYQFLNFSKRISFEDFSFVACHLSHVIGSCVGGVCVHRIRDNSSTKWICAPSIRVVNSILEKESIDESKTIYFTHFEDPTCRLSNFLGEQPQCTQATYPFMGEVQLSGCVVHFYHTIVYSLHGPANLMKCTIPTYRSARKCLHILLCDMSFL